MGYNFFLMKTKNEKFFWKGKEAVENWISTMNRKFYVKAGAENGPVMW